MKRSVILTTAVLFCAVISLAQNTKFNINEVYRIERSHSYVGFSVKYMGYAMVKGRFEKFNGSIRYDQNDHTKTSVSISIDVASIDTDLEWRDKDLKSEGWFDAEKFPNITFESTSVKQTETGLDVLGNLTIRDITKEVTMKMNPASGVLKDTRGDAQVIFTGNLAVDRTDYGVAGERWSAIKEGITGVEKQVNIEVSILGKQIKERNAKGRVQNTEQPPGKIYALINEQGIDYALAEFDKMKAPSDSKVNANLLKIVGYVLLTEGKVDDALVVFKKNMEAFPEDGNLNGSYAEALAHKGDLKQAKKYYELAYEHNNVNINAKEILRHLK